MIEIIERILERLLAAPIEMAMVVTMGAVVLSLPIALAIGAVMFARVASAFREPALEWLESKNRQNKLREEAEIREAKRREADENRRDAERDRFQRRVGVLEDKIKELRDQFDETSRRAKLLDGELTQAKASIEAAVRELETGKQNHLKVVAENETLRQKTTAMEEKIVTLHQIAEAAESSRKLEAEEKAKLVSDLSTLRVEYEVLLKAMQRRETEHSNEITEWRERFVRSEVEIELLQKRIAELERSGIRPLEIPTAPALPVEATPASKEAPTTAPPTTTTTKEKPS